MIFVAFVKERYETDTDIMGGTVDLFGPFESREAASNWAYTENRSLEWGFWRIVSEQVPTYRWGKYD